MNRLYIIIIIFSVLVISISSFLLFHSSSKIGGVESNIINNPVIPPSQFAKSLYNNDVKNVSGGYNNCLFDAVISASEMKNPSTGSLVDSQRLREVCDSYLIQEGFPTIPINQPAGEQYLQALSRVLDRPVSVFSGDSHIADVRHSLASENNDPVKISHSGTDMNGHWTPILTRRKT